MAAFAVLVFSGGLFQSLANTHPGTWSSVRELGLRAADVVGIGMLAVTVRRFGWSNLMRHNRALFALWIWLLIASLWSVRRVDSLTYSLGLVPTFGTWLAIATWPSLRVQVAVVVCGFGSGLALSSLLWFWYRPYLDSEFGAMGVWNHRNFLGHAATIGMVSSICALIIKPRVRTLLIAALLVLPLGAWWLFRSESKTPLFTFAAAAIAVLVLHLAVLTEKRRPSTGRYVFGALGLALAIAVAAAAPILAKNSADDRPTVAPTLKNLSNRTVMWRALRPHLVDGIWTGYGPNHQFFKATDRSAEVDRTVDFLVPHPHNGFIDALLEGGVGLLAIEIGLIATALVRAWRTAQSDKAAATALYLLITVAVTLNLTEPDFFLTMPPTLLFLLLGCQTAQRIPKL